MKLDAKIVVLSTYQYSQVLIAIVVSFVFHQPDRQHPISETGSCLSHLQCGQGIRLVVLRYHCTKKLHLYESARLRNVNKTCWQNSLNRNLKNLKKSRSLKITKRYLKIRKVTVYKLFLIAQNIIVRIYLLNRLLKWNEHKMFFYNMKITSKQQKKTLYCVIWL